MQTLLLLVAMYVGSVSGGLISATLLRMPGTPSSIMTTFDEREQAFEKKYAHDAEMQFKAEARRNKLLGLWAAGLMGLRLNGHPEKRLPNTLSLSFKGLEANRILEEIGLEVAASAGAACHSDTVQLSHVLEAMRIPVKWAKGTVRFSTGRMTTADQIDQAVAVVVDAVTKLRRSLD